MKALFLDRDGTVNIDRVYINDPRLMELIPGAAEAIALAQRAGYRIHIVTNQSGIGRGIIPPDVLPLIHRRMEELLRLEGAEAPDSYEICPHAPREQCQCRKPLPKLILDAALRHGIDLSASIMVGDKVTDVECGKRAGCGKSYLVRTGAGSKEEALLRFTQNPRAEMVPDGVFNDLLAVVQAELGD
jgi:D-glycero-D-manno-heptose 1,7-bisphosphate phosphatase